VNVALKAIQVLEVKMVLQALLVKRETVVILEQMV
jgi:hypothetical protein